MTDPQTTEKPVERTMDRKEFVSLAARIAAVAATWASQAADIRSRAHMASGSPQLFVGEIRDILSFIDPEAANGKRVVK